MNTNQYTQKTLEALQAAQQLAVEYQHNALEPAHLLHALAAQENGLIPQLLQKLNVDPGSFAAAVAEKLSALPRVSGSGRDPDKVYISQATDKVLSAAAREAKAMKDDFISVEHLFLGLLDEQDQTTSELFRAFNLKKDTFLQQLTAVRGNQRVTTDNPEDTYNALQKYGQDLVELARKQKLDPVIGRDQEIRNVIRILSRKTKNNPCLIGEPGVGKTAIADGLAQAVFFRDLEICDGAGIVAAHLDCVDDEIRSGKRFPAVLCAQIRTDRSRAAVALVDGLQNGCALFQTLAVDVIQGDLHALERIRVDAVSQNVAQKDRAACAHKCDLYHCTASLHTV